MKEQLLIFGSCVSRDILRFDTQGYFEIVRYFARSSFASLSSEPYVDKSILEKITSNFQKRMVEWDMSKEFWLFLQQGNYDFLLLDMIDTRFHLHKIHSKYLHTISSEYQAGCDKRISSSQIIHRDSKEFFNLWLEGLKKFSRITEAFQEKIICIKPYWTNLLAGGGAFMDIKLIAPFNHLLENYYQALQDYLPKATFIEYPQGLLEADPNHQWGLATMHYKEEFYLYGLQKMREICKAYEEKL